MQASSLDSRTARERSLLPPPERSCDGRTDAGRRFHLEAPQAALGAER